MAKLKMLLKGGTRTLQFGVFNTTDNKIEVVDKGDLNIQFDIFTNTVTIFNEPTENFYVTLEGNFNNISFGTGREPLLECSLIGEHNITSMIGMFSGCDSLTTIHNFNTSNVVEMASMFERCSSLTTIEELDVSNVRDGSGFNDTFRECSSLKLVKLKGLNDNISFLHSPLLNSESIHYLLNNTQKLTGASRSITFNENTLGLKDLYLNDESYINAINNGWTILPTVTNVERPNYTNPFKVVYADSLEKYNALPNPDMNTMYIIGEGNNEMIIFNNQLVSNKGIKLERL